LTTGRKYHLLTTFTWLDFIDVAKGINVISLIMILKKKKEKYWEEESWNKRYWEGEWSHIQWTEIQSKEKGKMTYKRKNEEE